MPFFIVAPQALYSFQFYLVGLWVVGMIYYTMILYSNTCPHNIIKENAVLMVFQKDGLYKTSHRMSLTNEDYRLLQPFLIIYFGNDNCNINVAPRIGRAFRVRAI